jgi:hypothetical protein
VVVKQGEDYWMGWKYLSNGEKAVLFASPENELSEPFLSLLTP